MFFFFIIILIRTEIMLDYFLLFLGVTFTKGLFHNDPYFVFYVIDIS